MYQLYYYPNNASLAPHFLLHFMRLDYHLLLVDRTSNHHKTAEYLTINPAGRIPTLIDNETVIFESSAICIYLCEKNPEYGLMPQLGSKARPQFFQWLAYLNNTLQAELMVRYYPRRHTNDERTVSNIVAAQNDLIGDSLSVINDQLEGNQYLLGDEISACDFFLFMLSEWSLPVKNSPLSFKYLSDYLNRLSSHSTIIAVCELEGIDLSPFK